MKYIPKTKKFDCLGRGGQTFLFFSKVVKWIEVRGDLSGTVENKESFRSRPSAWKNYAPALVSCAFIKNSKSIRFFRYQINVVALFSTGGQSASQTLLIFHCTRQVSPDFYPFHNF